MEISLALSGGAARGAFHLGVLDRFDEVGVKINALSGASIGSFVAVAYASGLSPREIFDIIKTSDFKKIFSLNFRFKSFFKIDEGSEILKEFLKFEDLSELPIPVSISAVDLKSGEVIYFSSGNILKIVLGSCAIVPIFNAVEYDNYILADGCFIDNLPIKPLLKFNHKIVAVDLQPINQFEKVGILSSTRRALKIALTPSRENLSQNSIYITDPNLAKISLFGFRDFDKLFKMGRAAISDEILDRIRGVNVKCV